MSTFGARWYDPAIDRFMGYDPVGFDDGNPHSFNRYGYGNNNPHKFMDPDGRLPMLAPLAAAGATVATTRGPKIAAAAQVAGTRIANNPTAGSATATVASIVSNTPGPGSFSVANFTGYPAGLAKPSSPVTLISGEIYSNARKAADGVIRKTRDIFGIKGKDHEIHEIIPVKFVGHPTDPTNKALIPKEMHKEATGFWRDLQRFIESTNKD